MSETPQVLRLAERERLLQALVPLWPSEIRDVSSTGRLKLLAALRCALRAERRREISGHWSYDLSRHRALLTAYRSETRALLKK